MHKVTHLRDIEAPCEEVFNTVVDIEKRMQLSPLWGLSQLLQVSENYPAPESRYRVRIIPGAPFGLSQGTPNGAQSALAGLAEFLMLKYGQSPESSISDDAQPQELSAEADDAPVEHDYIVVEYQPQHQFVYQLDDDCKTLITWSFKSIPLGTRITYEECFCDDSMCDQNFISTMHKVIQEWLTNIKRYSELRSHRGRRFIKWLLDHYYLKLRPDQRRVVLIMLLMQAVGLATFLIAALVWGLPRLFL